MKPTELKRALNCAVKAAHAAGGLMRRNQYRAKRITSEIQHDIKLELDVRSQKLIERMLLAQFPETAVLGEEGVRGDQASPWRWVVDPIDGTVNFTYGIPHACVSIALQRRKEEFKIQNSKFKIRSAIRDDDAAYATMAGVVYDPFCDELWTAIRGGGARLNGKVIRTSTRARMNQIIVSLGFSKSPQSVELALAAFNQLIRRIRKVRVMGAAALGMVYVASGRVDAYLEPGLRLWDIAAGGLILECAGGDFHQWQLPGEHTYAVIANNGLLRRKIQAIAKFSPAL